MAVSLTEVVRLCKTTYKSTQMTTLAVPTFDFLVILPNIIFDD